MDHAVDDVKIMPDGDEVRISECTVIDFASGYTAIAAKKMGPVAKRATGDLRRASYLARLPFGHLPFCL